MTTPPVLDAHVHVWDWQLEGFDWIDASMEAIRRVFSPQDLRTQLQTHGVAGAVLVQTCASLRETEEFLALAAAHREVVAVVGWVDLTDPAIDEVLAALRGRPGGDRLVGIRHQVHDEPDPAWLDRDDVRRGITALGRAGLVYDVLVRPRELPAAIRLVRDLDDQRFVLDHLAKPPIASGQTEPWTSLLRDLAEPPNITCKLSGLVTEADLDAWTIDDLRPYAQRVIETFGPARILFGSDWPVCTVAASYGQVLDAARELTSQLSDHERARIFHATATEVYGLPVDAFPEDRR